VTGYRCQERIICRECLLPVTCYLLPVTCYLLPVTCYLLPVAFGLTPFGRHRGPFFVLCASRENSMIRLMRSVWLRPSAAAW
jgi:hypothetical protein